MAITDIAQNALTVSGNTGQMLGHVEPEAPAEVLPLRMYDFLIEIIRKEDQNRGNLFVKRFLEGPQEIWDRIQRDIFSTKDLWDVTRIPVPFLKYLQNIVGWTPELQKTITSKITDAQLRKLISLSTPLWKIRGIEEAYATFITLLFTLRMRSWNYFDLRWILDETILGEDRQGRDPNILDIDGTATRESNLRIVDDGDLDRELILNMIRLFRPAGERIMVTWLGFLDQFTTDDDDTQWSSAADITVEAGTFSLSDDTQLEEANVSVDGSLSWLEYVVYWRAKGTGPAFGCLFRYQDSDNYYIAELRPDTNEVALVERKSGIEADLDSVSLPVVGDVYYGVRVHVDTIGSDTRIRLYLNNDEIIDFLDTTNPLTKGGVGVRHSTGSIIDLDEVEVFHIPIEYDYIDINS